MFDHVNPSEKREEAPALIQAAGEKYGVPYASVRKALYWEIHKSKKPITSIADLSERLMRLPALLNQYNRDVALKQLMHTAQIDLEQV